MNEQSRGWGWGLKWRWLIAIFIVAAGLDFAGFLSRAQDTEASPPALPVDGIVVLTGGSGLRIQAGLELLSDGFGERMLISGVHPDIGREDLAERIGGDAQLYACCVDIGHAARTTVENTREVGAWAHNQGYSSILLVTSDYHMPRSLLLLNREPSTRDLSIFLFPVATRIDPARPLKDWRTFRGLMLEWLKWRVTLIGSIGS